MKFTKLALMAGASVLMLGAASCSDSDDPQPVDNAKDTEFAAIADQYLDNTVGITYTNLAANAEQLVLDLAAVQDSKTDANVLKACETFLEARAWWEKSEAFLFGPASDFGIDPHIDSWPLDRDGLVAQLHNTSHIESMAAEDGDEWAGNHLGPELLGFHGIEYILFADGQPKAASVIPADELIYAIAVAGDLRNKCYQLEVSWLGDKAPAAHIEKVEDLELNCTVGGGDNSYSENMRNAGKAGSTYRSMTDAMQAIIDGCASIVDEVGTQKIGKPHTGEDPNYIESPYSHKSIIDFYDNMISVQNSYMGGIDGRRDESKSIHAYIAKVNPSLDKKCTAAIEGALAAISAMKAPFVQNYRDASAQSAMDACTELNEVLMEVKAELAK